MNQPALVVLCHGAAGAGVARDDDDILAPVVYAALASQRVSDAEASSFHDLLHGLYRQDW